MELSQILWLETVFSRSCLAKKLFFCKILTQKHFNKTRAEKQINQYDLWSFIKDGSSQIQVLKMFSRSHDFIRGGGTGGARVACASPIFLGQRNKIHLEFCLFSWLISVMHPLFSAPRAVPVYNLLKIFLSSKD